MTDSADVRALLLSLGAALTMTGDAVSQIQERLRAIAAAYGYEQAHISVFPTLLIVSLGDGEPAGIRTIDAVRELTLDHASEVFAIARRAQSGKLTASEAQTALAAALVAPPRFGTVA